MELPDFCVEEAAEELVAGDAREAGGGEGGLGVGEAGDAEAGEDAEGEVEEADVEGGEGRRMGLGGMAKSERSQRVPGAGVRGDSVGEGLKFGLGEAVEEEVGDDEVGAWGWCDGEGGGLEGADAFGIGLAAVVEEVKHGGAGVDGEGAEVGSACQEAGEEAAVAVAEDEGSAAGWEVVEEVGAGALEEGAEGEVFGEAVDAGYGIEVGLGRLAAFVHEPMRGTVHFAALWSR